MYHPRRALEFAAHEKRCHIGKSPSLRDAYLLYGREEVSGVVQDYIRAFLAYARPGSRIEFDVELMAGVIVSQFPTMRVSEFCLFFIKAMAGKFGKFHGNIEPMDITTRLAEWDNECKSIRNELMAAAFEQYKQLHSTHDFEEYRISVDSDGQLVISL